jgi:hypothetical protein
MFGFHRGVVLLTEGVYFRGPSPQMRLTLKIRSREGGFMPGRGVQAVWTGLMILCVAPAAAQHRVGTEFQVNSFSTGSQWGLAIAPGADGGFVAVWASEGHAGDWWQEDVFGQRLSAAGVPLGAEFRVNTHEFGDQWSPAVSADADGDFVVVWESGWAQGSFSQDGWGIGIFGQRFAADGTPRGAEFQINTYTTGDQEEPSVACDAEGNFLVTWESDYFTDQDGDYIGVLGQLFASDGTRIGGEFVVNEYTTGEQSYASAAADGQGNFVVAWRSDRYGWADILNARAIPRDGSAPGPEFRIRNLDGTEGRPAVASDGQGNMVGAWYTNYGLYQNPGVHGQRFKSDGTLVGPGFQINTYTDSRKSQPSVAMNAAGDFVVSWSSGYPTGNYWWLPTQEGDSWGVFAQRFASTGARVGHEFQVNTYTRGSQGEPSVVYTGGGQFLVAWGGPAAADSATRYTDFFGQLHDGQIPSANVVGRVLDFGGDAKADLLWYNTATGQVYLWTMNGGAATAFGSVTTVGDLNWKVAAGGDFDGNGRGDLMWRNQVTGQVYLWLMNGAAIQSALLVANVPDLDWQIVASGDTDGDGRSDLLWQNESNGRLYVWKMNGAAILSSALVSTVKNLAWRVIALRDIEGDGKADMLWRHESTGQVFLWRLNGAVLLSGAAIATIGDFNWTVVASGDLDGDSRSDLVWQNRSTGQVSLWRMNGGTITSTAVITTVSDPNWTVAAAGDFNADRRTDLLWHHRGSGQVYAWLMNGATISSATPVGMVPDLAWRPQPLY